MKKGSIRTICNAEQLIVDKEAFIHTALDQVEENPFGGIQLMDLEQHQEWIAYDRQKLIDSYLFRQQPTVNLKNGPAEPEIIFGLGEYSGNRIISWELSPDYMSRDDFQTILQNYVSEWMYIFPELDWVRIDAHPLVADFMEEYELERLPACFNNYPGWIHVIQKRCLEGLFSIEDLMDLPFNKIEMIMEELLLVQFYSAPYGWQNQEVRDGLQNLVEEIHDISLA